MKILFVQTKGDDVCLETFIRFRLFTGCLQQPVTRWSQKHIGTCYFYYFTKVHNVLF